MPKSEGFLYAERIQQGLCPRCGGKHGTPEPPSKLCPYCQDKGRQYVKKHREQYGRTDNRARVSDLEKALKRYPFRPHAPVSFGENMQERRKRLGLE